MCWGVLELPGCQLAAAPSTISVLGTKRTALTRSRRVTSMTHICNAFWRLVKIKHCHFSPKSASDESLCSRSASEDSAVRTPHSNSAFSREDCSIIYTGSPQLKDTMMPVSTGIALCIVELRVKPAHPPKAVVWLQVLNGVVQVRWRVPS